jgi:hypothetical protein
MMRLNVQTWTIQFWVRDVTFRCGGLVLPSTAPLHQLEQAKSVTLYLDNQKTGDRSATIYHMTCPTWFCPVKSLAWHVASIMTQHGCLKPALP